MRHGIRAPHTTYPLDPKANDPTRFPNGKSQLTDVSKLYFIYYSP